MEMGQGHNSAGTQPIDLKIGRINVFVKFYRSRQRSNFKTELSALEKHHKARFGSNHFASVG